MAQLSRPYQIALGALVVAALMWFLAFGHRSRSAGGSAANTPAQSAATPPSSGSGGSVNGSSQIYHGAAPGVEGLTRAIAKAHGAAATSESYRQHIEEKSAAATSTTPGEGAAVVSGSSSPAGSAPAAASTSKTTVHVHAHTTAPAAAAHAAPARSHAPVKKSAPAAKAHPGRTAPSSAVPSGQKAVEGTVSHGKVALLLFWNPSGADDVAVHGQVSSLRGAHLPVVVYEGTAKTVASFGAITRQVPVYGTPTILIIGTKGRTTLLTGLQDAFAIEQAIHEARSTSP